MIRKTLIAATALTLLAGPALAFQCPSDISKIDAALGSTMISATDKAKVTQLRDQGAAQHAAGNHSASIATLAQAKKILGIGSSSGY